MKLRFRKNSLRLRLNQIEVERLSAGETLEERVEFPGGGEFSYLLMTSDTETATAQFSQGVIGITAPRNLVGAWAANSGEIGMYFSLPAKSNALKIAIEKDLECVDGPEEERDPNAFPREEQKTC